MTHNRSTVSPYATDEDLIRHFRLCGDPLVEDLCRRLAEALDKNEEIGAELAASDGWLARRYQPLTDDQCDQIADAILKAAGSGLRHYTVPKIRSDIRAAVRAAVGEVLDGDEL